MEYPFSLCTIAGAPSFDTIQPLLARALLFSTADVVDFYRDNRALLEDQPALKIGGFHGVQKPTVRLSIVASLTDPQEARELADQTDAVGAMNFHRFELSKASLVVGNSTHGPGQIDAVFRGADGVEFCSQDLAYRTWQEGLDVSCHPLGVVVDGDLYRPVTPEKEDSAATDVGDPLLLDTYRGAESKPWQLV